MAQTHQVINQVPALLDIDLAAADPVLLEAVEREGAGWARTELHRVGMAAGSAEVIEAGFEANRNPPRLVTHDPGGHRIDEVRYHPAYHRLMELSVGAGLHGSAWADGRRGAHVARAAAFYLMAQAEAGHGCPISMTYSAVPALRIEPEVAARWEPAATTPVYDPRLLPPGDKAGVLIGMAMTEKQGGSDVRANTTRAEPYGEGAYALTGHKWFCSAPMSDAFLVLAQAAGGLSCFLLPRFTPEGDRNRIRLQRLKDKLGNRSNASSEVEFEGAWAQLVGEEGRGVATILEMVNRTRLDCVLGSAAGMRLGTRQAIHHARHRRAFGAELVDQPIMRNVLADLAVEAEAAGLTALRLAGAYDRHDDPAEAAFRRLATAVAKYWVCKRAVGHAGEALECLGGNGYVEESPMPRLLRESPLNSIWEGSGNVICLDVLRALRRRPEAGEALLAEVRLAEGLSGPLDRRIRRLETALAKTDEGGARRLVELMALALQGSLVLRHSPPAVADAFVAGRLEEGAGGAYGTLPSGLDLAGVVATAVS